MSILPQPSLFSWKEVEAGPELSRLARILDILPDQPLSTRSKLGVEADVIDYPLAALWRALLAALVFNHPSLASCSRELARNGQLRDLCGFDPLRVQRVAPPDHVWSRFFKKLLALRPLVDAMFEDLLDQVAQLLPGFGRNLAIDGKAISAWSRKDPNADEGFKNYEGEDDNGSPFQKIKSWFGYKLHLVVDVNYELPVAFELTRASQGESPRLLPMIDKLKLDHPRLHGRIETLAADRGYDDGADKAALYDAHGISPLIDSRDMCQGQFKPLDDQKHDTIYVGPTGQVACKIDPFEPDRDKAFAPMQFMGFESGRDTLKFRCPAAAFGLTCRNREACACSPTARRSDYGRVVRVKLDRDRRLFTPIYRHSETFVAGYAQRTAVERVNSRIDHVYGFERHFIRGQEKVGLRLGLAMVVMLATAVAWVKAGRQDRVASLRQAA